MSDSKHYATGWIDTDASKRSDDGKSLRVAGYGVVFDAPSERMGRIVETVDRKAFDEVLSDAPDVRFLIEHDGLALGRTGNNTLRLHTDDVGLRFELDLNPADPDAQRLYAKVERGDVTQTSFGFIIGDIEESRSDDDETVRVHITRVKKLFEISAVTFPAYPQTSMHTVSGGERSIPDVGVSQRNRLRVLDLYR